MFEQTTSNKNEQNCTIQNPEQTITTFIDSRRKIDCVVNDPTKLSGYIGKGIEEWAKRMQVTLGKTPFISPIISPTETVPQTADVKYFQEKMAVFFQEKKPFENLPSENEAINKALSNFSQEKKTFGNVPPTKVVKKENFLKKVKEDFLKLNETQKEKLTNFILIALNINEPGLLHASSAFLSNGFLMTGIDNYKIEGCKDLIIKMTSDQNIYFESKGIIRCLKGENVGEFVYNGFINFVKGEQTKEEEVRIQDYLKFTSYDKFLTSSLEQIIRLFKLPRKNIYEILDDLISQPKECDINEVSILIRELIYRTFQELLKISNSDEFKPRLVKWLDSKDENNRQDRKNKYWWRIERRLQVFSETEHSILSERYEIKTNGLLGIDILNILQQAIIRKIMANIFNDYKFIFCELVDAIKTKESQIPKDFVNKAKEFLSENQTLDSSLTDPKSVIECYENKITGLFDYFKKQLELNSNRNNGRIWFFKFFNPLSPLEKYIDEMHKQTISFMKMFADSGDYYLFTTSKQNNSSQVSDETLSKLIKML
jgi:hypothetical protein